MVYIIKKTDFMEYLRSRKDLSIDEKAKRFDDFDNIILCPYRGHEIDLRKVRENSCNFRTEEFRCPECDEWIWWDKHLPWFQQFPCNFHFSHIIHPETYKCIVNPKFEDPSYYPTEDELIIWYDKNLNPIRPKTIPLNPGEKAIFLDEKAYVAIKE